MSTRSKMKSKLAKNRKKGWKKVDIADVEDAIADERIQERTGGIVAEKSDDQLFFIDGSVDIPKSSATELSSSKSRPETKPLRCFANLEPDPRIPAISRQVSGHSKQKALRDARPVTRTLTQSVQHSKKALHRRHATRRQQQQMHQEAYDLWGNDSNKHVNEHFAVVTKKKRVKVPTTLHKKPSTVAAVEAPHPGSSYNPAFGDHQELLQKTVVKQVREDVDEAKLEKKLKPNYGSEGPPTQESYLSEMSQGLGLDEVDDQSDAGSADEQSEDEEAANKSSKAPKLKTKKQKRKQKERLKEKLRRLKEKEERMRQDRNSNERLRTIKKRVEERERLLAEKAAQRKLHRMEESGKTRRLNKKKFVEPDEDVLLTSELKGSMVLTRCNNSLLDDRFKSLQKRNIIEPRSRAKFRRKYKPKFAEKKPFKEITAKSRAGGGIIIPFHQKKHNEKE